MHATVGAILSGVAPYAVYRIACGAYGLQASLVNLTGERLMKLIFAYSIANPLLHHLWFFLA
jgi:hypothetical protein